jgi:hypothetical protein
MTKSHLKLFSVAFRTIRLENIYFSSSQEQNISFFVNCVFFKYNIIENVRY